MISVLIPVFNHDISELASVLSNQLVKTGPPAEIIILDDGSNTDFKKRNSQISDLPYVKYLELPANVGRSKIRTLLAEKASFQWLLFLDGDSKIIRENFISSYCERIGSNTDVLVGGREYYPSVPADCRFRLHWKYGTIREASFYTGRAGLKYAGFISNNFLIRRQLFQQLESFQSPHYGHEDTWTGIELQRLQAGITFIQNPVLHDHLENASEFIRKAESAVRNLAILSTKVSPDVLKDHVKLYRYYRRVKRFGATAIISLFVQKFEKRVLKNLHSCNPSLLLFDLYRLKVFIDTQQR